MHKYHRLDLHKTSAWVSVCASWDGWLNIEHHWHCQSLFFHVWSVEGRSYQRGSNALCTGSFDKELMCRRRFVHCMNLTVVAVVFTHCLKPLPCQARVFFYFLPWNLTFYYSLRFNFMAETFYALTIYFKDDNLLAHKNGKILPCGDE